MPRTAENSPTGKSDAYNRVRPISPAPRSEVAVNDPVPLPLDWPRFRAVHAEWRCARPRPTVAIPPAIRAAIELAELLRRRRVLSGPGRRPARRSPRRRVRAAG